MNDEALARARRSARHVILAVFLSMMTIVFCLWKLQVPAIFVYDEVYYVTAAMLMLPDHELLQALLIHGNSQLENVLMFGGPHFLTHVFNPEQPPLGKEIIAFGMWMTKQTAAGWRLMSVCFGAAAIAGMYFWSLQLFRDKTAPLWVALLTMVNQALYVQARMADLDIFLLTFLIWGLAFFTRTWIVKKVRLNFFAVGVFIGLAASTKWVGFIALTIILGMVACIKLLQLAQFKLKNNGVRNWYRTDLWREMTILDWILSLVVLPVSIYILSFLPEQGFHLLAILQRQQEMWLLMSLGHAPRPFMSHWWQWPLLSKTILYAIQTKITGNQMTVRVIMLVGSPLIAWGGLVGILACLHGWRLKLEYNAVIILLFWAGLILFWLIAPRDSMYWYYYLPSYTILSLALAYLFFETRLHDLFLLRWLFLAAAAIFFIIYLPISNAVQSLSVVALNHYLWFESIDFAQKGSGIFVHSKF